MAFVFNTIEAVDREFLGRVEKVQHRHKDKIGLRHIDIYKRDRISCCLDDTKTPSLIFMKDRDC